MKYSNPAKTEKAFYAALRSLDSVAMRNVWTDDPKAYCVHPGGPALRGLESILQSWSNILNAADPPAISYRMIEQNIGRQVAIHLVEESIRTSALSTKPPSLILATNVYILHAGSWRLLVHHASLPLVGRDSAPKDRPLH